MLSTGDKALQAIPGFQITKLGHGRQLFVVQHQHTLDHHLLLVEQQARLILLDPFDAGVARALGMAVWFSSESDCTLAVDSGNSISCVLVARAGIRLFIDRNGSAYLPDGAKPPYITCLRPRFATGRCDRPPRAASRTAGRNLRMTSHGYRPAARCRLGLRTDTASWPSVRHPSESEPKDCRLVPADPQIR